MVFKTTTRFENKTTVQTNIILKTGPPAFSKLANPPFQNCLSRILTTVTAACSTLRPDYPEVPFKTVQTACSKLQKPHFQNCATIFRN
eukprot:1175150-Heterocapsa_arctica.AAC.1